MTDLIPPWSGFSRWRYTSPLSLFGASGGDGARHARAYGGPARGARRALRLRLRGRWRRGGEGESRARSSRSSSDRVTPGGRLRNRWGGGSTPVGRRPCQPNGRGYLVLGWNKKKGYRVSTTNRWLSAGQSLSESCLCVEWLPLVYEHRDNDCTQSCDLDSDSSWIQPTKCFRLG